MHSSNKNKKKILNFSRQIKTTILVFIKKKVDSNNSKNRKTMKNFHSIEQFNFEKTDLNFFGFQRRNYNFYFYFQTKKKNLFFLDNDNALKKIILLKTPEIS